MASYVTTSAILTDTTVLYSTQAAGYPATNVYDYAHPYRAWRATGLGTGEYVGYDLGGATQVYGFFLDRCNGTTVTVEWSAASNFGAITESCEVTPTTCPITGRTKAFAYSATKATGGTLTGDPNRRYVRVRNTSGSVTDGTSAFSVGSFVLFTDLDEWTHSSGWPYRKEYIRAVLSNAEGLAGGRDPVIVGNPHARIMLPQSGMQSTMESQLLSVAQYGEGTILFFFRNYNSDLSEAYLARIVGGFSVAWTSPNAIEMSSCILEEVV